MYINEVIRAVQREYPSEYDTPDMLVWCNEVSSMLAVESRIVYKEIRPPLAKDGTALLPTDVRAENVVKILVDGREIPLRDARTAGRRMHIGKYLTLHEITDRYTPKLTVIYEAPYEPIRQTKYTGSVKLDTENNTISLYDCEFIPGDVLTVTVSGKTPTTVNLLDVDYDPESERGYILTVGSGELDDFTAASYENAVIERVITDRTVCDAPHDAMYKYYILARIAQCQHDPDMYTQYMQEFNSLLARYREWLSARMPNEPIRLKNIW
ncbi:MAG: hypothetical protein ACI38A_07200 [Candidatus Ornithomonoglobus sp.]